MKKTVVLTAVATALTGCVAATHFEPPKTMDLTTPTINTHASVSLGERMLEAGTVTTVDTFTLINDVSIFDGVVLAGEYHKLGTESGNSVFYPPKGYGTGIVGGLSRVPSPAKPYIDAATGELCFLGSFHTSFCSDTKPVVKEKNLYTEDSFMQELIYTGKVNNKIRFTYREYAGGMARNAFSVDVEYDLNTSNTISYKGASIRIDDATNQKIDYVVLKHFK